MNTHEKILNKSTVQTDHVPWICLIQGDLPLHTHTHTSNVLPGFLLRVSHPCLWPIKAPGSIC